MAKASSLWIRFSRYSCFLANISSVSRRRARASWVLGAARAREERVPLKNLPNLLMAERAVVGERPSALETGEPPQSERQSSPGNQQVVSAGDTHSRAFPGQARPRPRIATREMGRADGATALWESGNREKLARSEGLTTLSALGTHPGATAEKGAQRKANPSPSKGV